MAEDVTSRRAGETKHLNRQRLDNRAISSSKIYVRHTTMTTEDGECTEQMEHSMVYGEWAQKGAMSHTATQHLPRFSVKCTAFLVFCITWGRVRVVLAPCGPAFPPAGSPYAERAVASDRPVSTPLAQGGDHKITIYLGATPKQGTQTSSTSGAFFSDLLGKPSHCCVFRDENQKKNVMSR